MKIVKFKHSFTISDTNGSRYNIQNKGHYVFSDFVLREFIKSVNKQPSELIDYINELDHEYKIINFASSDGELQYLRGLIIVRTGGIGDLIALSYIPQLTSEIYKKVYNSHLKCFFITSNRYAPLFNYYTHHVFPIFYFQTQIDKAARDVNIYEKSRINSVFFEGIIEESDENWFDLQWKRMNIHQFKHLDKLDENSLIKRPFLKTKKEALEIASTYLRKTNSQVLKTLNILKENNQNIILINHRASAWIRTFNPFDVVVTLRDYLKSKNITNYKFILLPRNFTKTDKIKFIDTTHDDVVLLNTNNLHEFFYTIAISDFVISSDTAAQHFREGISAPGLGIYASFPSKMRCAYYKYSKAEDILYKECQFVSDKNNYVGCASHFKTPYEVCPLIGERYKEYLTSDHHRKRGNRIPNPQMIKELENFVAHMTYEKLEDEEIFQYAPCCSARWNSDFPTQLMEIYEKHDIQQYLSKNNATKIFTLDNTILNNILTFSDTSHIKKETLKKGIKKRSKKKKK